MATGRARVALDRPVQANGRPVPTPTGAGVVLLRNDGSGPRATLGAVVGDSGDTKLVLRNALVWATRAAAVVADGTLRDYDLREVKVAQTIIQQSREVWLAADHSKFHRQAMVELASLRQIDRLFTDAPPPSPFDRLLADAEVQCVVAQ
jgi:DeoR/GlpR family transcriptional regulator of sugar metabolism